MHTWFTEEEEVCFAGSLISICSTLFRTGIRSVFGVSSGCNVGTSGFVSESSFCATHASGSFTFSLFAAAFTGL